MVRTYLINWLIFVSDLQFSSEDEEEFDEVPLSPGPEQIGVSVPIDPSDNNMGIQILGADDDSQQAAEAMVQLGNAGFYQTQQSDLAENQLIQGYNFNQNYGVSTRYHYIIRLTLTRGFDYIYVERNNKFFLLHSSTQIKTLVGRNIDFLM